MSAWDLIRDYFANDGGRMLPKNQAELVVHERRGGGKRVEFESHEERGQFLRAIDLLATPVRIAVHTQWRVRVDKKFVPAEPPGARHQHNIAPIAEEFGKALQSAAGTGFTVDVVGGPFNANTSDEAIDQWRQKRVFAGDEPNRIDRTYEALIANVELSRQAAALAPAAGYEVSERKPGEPLTAAQAEKAFFHVARMAEIERLARPDECVRDTQRALNAAEALFALKQHHEQREALPKNETIDYLAPQPAFAWLRELADEGRNWTPGSDAHPWPTERVIRHDTVDGETRVYELKRTHRIDADRIRRRSISAGTTANAAIESHLWFQQQAAERIVRAAFMRGDMADGVQSLFTAPDESHKRRRRSLKP